jgi:flagellar hook protein FlgE
LSQTISSATSSTATTGGTNPVQLGLGVSVASTSTDMSVGSTATTSSALDVALSGAGFFIVQGGGVGEYQFTRAGNLSIDSEGNLNVDGNLVCGWEQYTLDADGNKVYNTDSEVEPINIYSDDYSGNKKIMAAEASTSADFTGSLDSGDTVAAGATGLTAIGDTTDLDFDTTSDMTVYDAQGNSYDVTISWKKCAVENGTTSWYWEASSTDAAISPASGYVAFDSNGNMVTSATALSAAVDSTTNTAGYTYSDVSIGSGVTAGDYTVTVAASTTTSGSYDITLSDGTNTYTATSTDGSATFTTSSGTITLAAPTSLAAGTTAFTVSSNTYTFDSTPTLTVTPPTTAGTAAVNVAVDFADITTSNASSTSSTDASSVSGSADGYESGTLQSYTISSDGTISGVYSNGQTQSIAQIALAVFDNPEGLTKLGGNLYTTSLNSGDYDIVVAGSGGSGTMTSYTLEQSNVDLASEFSSMMISQRAYQANSKVISTADEMLQSLINMVG